MLLPLTAPRCRCHNPLHARNPAAATTPRHCTRTTPAAAPARCSRSQPTYNVLAYPPSSHPVTQSHATTAPAATLAATLAKGQARCTDIALYAHCLYAHCLCSGLQPSPPGPNWTRHDVSIQLNDQSSLHPLPLTLNKTTPLPGFVLLHLLHSSPSARLASHCHTPRRLDRLFLLFFFFLIFFLFKLLVYCATVRLIVFYICVRL